MCYWDLRLKPWSLFTSRNLTATNITIEVCKNLIIVTFHKIQLLCETFNKKMTNWRWFTFLTSRILSKKFPNYLASYIIIIIIITLFFNVCFPSTYGLNESFSPNLLATMIEMIFLDIIKTKTARHKVKLLKQKHLQLIL